MKVCFVGTGSIGKRHIQNLMLTAQREGFPLEIHLLRSTQRTLDSEIAAAAARICYATSELDARYDAIFITAPTHLHYPIMLELRGRAGCFFVEKPVFDRADLDITPFMSEAVYYVACPLRYTKVAMRAKEILRGERVLSARAICSSYLPDWRPGRDVRDCYSAHREQGGGVRLDLIHEWDLLIDLFGLPAEVMQMSGKYSSLAIDSEDLAIYLARYPDKLIELHLDYFGRLTQRYCEVFTDETVYRFDLIRRYILKDGEVLESFAETPNDMYLREMAYFCKLVQGATEERNTIAQAVRTMQIACGDTDGRRSP